MNMNKFNVFAGVLALFYFLILSFPLLKGLFDRKKNCKSATSEWVEEPLMIEEIKCSQ